MATSGVSPANNQELFRLCGFRDRDGNGAIVKRGVRPLQIRNEGYVEEADINRDGQINGTEAKLYLRTIEKVAPRDIRRFALSAADNLQLFSLFKERLSELGNLNGRKHGERILQGLNEILSELFVCELDNKSMKEILRSSAFMVRYLNVTWQHDTMGKFENNLVLLSLKNCSLDEALSMAKRSGLGDNIINNIAVKYLEAKKYKDALRCAHNMDRPENKLGLLIAVGKATSNRSLFVEAAGAARDLSGWDNQYKALLNIANISGALFFFIEAISVIDNAPSDSVVEYPAWDKDYAKVQVARAMAESGFLAEARQVTRSLNIKCPYFSWVYDITDKPIIHKAWKLLREGRPNEAIEEAKKIDFPPSRTITYIGFAEYFSGDPTNKLLVIKVYEEAFRACAQLEGYVGICDRFNISTYDESTKDYGFISLEKSEGDIKRHTLNMILASIKRSNISVDLLPRLYGKALAIIGSFGVDANKKYAGDKFLALVNFIRVTPFSKLPKDASRELLKSTIKLAMSLRGYTHTTWSHGAYGPEGNSLPCDRVAFREIEKIMQECGFSLEKMVQIWKESGMKTMILPVEGHLYGIDSLRYRNNTEFVKFDYIDNPGK